MFALGRFALIWCTTRISSATRSALLTFQTFWGLPVTSTRLQASRRPSTQRKQRSTTTVCLIKTEKEREGGEGGLCGGKRHSHTHAHSHTHTHSHKHTHKHTHTPTHTFLRSFTTGSHRKINPLGIVPVGPSMQVFEQPHDRQKQFQ